MVVPQSETAICPKRVKHCETRKKVIRPFSFFFYRYMDDFFPRFFFSFLRNYVGGRGCACGNGENGGRWRNISSGYFFKPFQDGSPVSGTNRSFFFRGLVPQNETAVSNEGFTTTRLGPQSPFFGDEPLVVRVVCPQNGTAALKDRSLGVCTPLPAVEKTTAVACELVQGSALSHDPGGKCYCGGVVC